MTNRSYGQYCGAAKALDLIGERWTLLIIRDLLLGPMRYGDLERSLAGIGTEVLADRLKRLQAAGAVTKRRLDPPAGATVYELTADGAGLGPALASLARFGLRLLDDPRESSDRFDLGWVLLLAAAECPGIARTSRGSYELRSAAGIWHVAIDAEGATAHRGAAHEPLLTIEAEEPILLAGLLAGRLDPDETLAAGRIRLTGSRAHLTRLLRALPLGLPSG